MLEFARLIERYAQTITLHHHGDGYWDGPEWVPGEVTEYEWVVAVLPITARDVQRYEGLGYTTQDIKIYAAAPLEMLDVEEDVTEEVAPEIGDEVVVGDRSYIIDSITDRTAHSDVVLFFCKHDQDDGDNND